MVTCDPKGVTRTALAEAALLLAGVGLLSAQVVPVPAPAAIRGSVSGTVLAAETGQPLAGAVAVLEAAEGAVLAAPDGGPFLVRALTTVTGDSGAYEFAGLPPGAYHLLIRHLGYHPATVTVDLTGVTPFRLSVGLLINPIRLEAITARVVPADPYGRFRAPSEAVRRGGLDAAEWRHNRFLEGDATVLTHSDVVEAVTLGETDLFRALQRLPGVSARDDYSAALWTRGAPWSQTRVYFDGQPLFNPVHAIGLFAGVNPDAVGVVAFLPGARSPALGEGAAGVVDIESRAARPGLRGVGELSVVSARGAGEWGSAGGRTGLSVSVRRSWADLATHLAQNLGADTGTWIPYAFVDLTGRFSTDLGGGYALEASGLLEEDGVHGQLRQLLRATAGTWGNQLGRVSLLSPLGTWAVRSTVGASRFDGAIQPIVAATPSTADLATHGPTRNSVAVVTASVDVAPRGGGPWSWGVAASALSQRYVGQFPRPYPVAVLPDTLVLAKRLTTVTAWGDERIALGRRVAVEAGLRIEAHGRVSGAPAFGVAPKVAVRVALAGLPLTLSAAAQRSWQYTQALAPAGPSVGPDLYLTDVWLLAGDTVPALRADVATAGAEAALGGAWVAAVNAYVRHTTGMTVPEPGPGQLTDSRPIFVSAVNDARGIEWSVRRLAGRWTVSGSYSMGHSDLVASSAMYPIRYAYPSPADRRRVANLTLMAPLGGGVRGGAAFTWASGAPYSRFLLGQASCPACAPSDSAALYIESPNGERGSTYAALDVLLDWSRPVGHVRLGVFAQVRNVLNRANAVTYTGSVYQCAAPHPPTLVAVGGGVCDRFDRGVPLLPLAGVRLVF